MLRSFESLAGVFVDDARVAEQLDALAQMTPGSTTAASFGTLLKRIRQ
jgi:hypothetical protein